MTGPIKSGLVLSSNQKGPTPTKPTSNMATNPQAYNFNTILEAIRVRLVSITGLDDAYVRKTASDEYQYEYPASMVVLRPLGPEPFSDAGGGRGARLEHRTIRVYCNVRSSLDQVGKDDVALQTLFALEDTVNDALDEFTPFSATDNTVKLTVEPLHPIQSGNSPVTREAKDDIGEIFSMLNYEVVYVRPNTIPIP